MPYMLIISYFNGALRLAMTVLVIMARIKYLRSK